MIRVVKLSGKYYGVELPKDKWDALEEVYQFAREGTPAIVLEDVADLEELGIYDEVEMVEKE